MRLVLATDVLVFLFIFFILKCNLPRGFQFQEKSCGEGPNLPTMFEDDRHLQNIITNIRDAVNKAFGAAGKYADTFEPFRVFYKENESLDLVALRQNDTGMYCVMGLIW